MWHYVWFKIYLESKDPLSYSSAENFASQNMGDKQSFLRLMPINRSISLEKNGENDDGDKLEEKLEELQSSIGKLCRLQSQLLAGFSRLDKANRRMEEKVNSALEQKKLK